MVRIEINGMILDRQNILEEKSQGLYVSSCFMQFLFILEKNTRPWYCLEFKII